MSGLDDYLETTVIALDEARHHGDQSPTIIYVLAGRPDGAVKIGITEHPVKRVARIQREMWQVFRVPIIIVEFMIMPTREGARQVEAEAHRLLADRSTGVGEWFYATPEEALEAIHKAIGLPT